MELKNNDLATKNLVRVNDPIDKNLFIFSTRNDGIKFM